MKLFLEKRDTIDFFSVDVTNVPVDVRRSALKESTSSALGESSEGPWSIFKTMGGEKLPYFAFYRNHERIDSIQTSNIEAVINKIKNHTAGVTCGPPSAGVFVEPLLKEDIDRLILFPIKNKAIWDMYKKHESTFWTAEELDLEADKKDFKEKLNDNERYFIKHVLAFFAASDAIVNETWSRTSWTKCSRPRHAVSTVSRS